ncbi:hypothetical protein ACRALDRAFT_2021237 [Sodiomyces alcalophilus JCM 7366]|uniref:uncharacterized protein n=1 Tax=Sodiomyces alcalophilus JCM 7366 TaxID=591952 RepID=UPI0039B58E82
MMSDMGGQQCIVCIQGRCMASISYRDIMGQVRSLTALYAYSIVLLVFAIFICPISILFSFSFAQFIILGIMSAVFPMPGLFIYLVYGVQGSSVCNVIQRTLIRANAGPPPCFPQFVTCKRRPLGMKFFPPMMRDSSLGRVWPQKRLNSYHEKCTNAGHNGFRFNIRVLP